MPLVPAPDYDRARKTIQARRRRARLSHSVPLPESSSDIERPAAPARPSTVYSRNHLNPSNIYTETSLYMSNLPKDITFRELFAYFPTAVTIAMEERVPLRFTSAVVDFGSREDAQTVYQESQNLTIREHRIYVVPKLKDRYL